MQQNVRRWLDDLPLDDPLERQQAGLLQVMLLIILGGCVIGLLISVINSVRMRRIWSSRLVVSLILAADVTALRTTLP